MRLLYQGSTTESQDPAIPSTNISGLVYQGLEGRSQKYPEGKGALNYLMCLRACLLPLQMQPGAVVIYCLPHLVLRRVLALQNLVRTTPSLS